MKLHKKTLLAIALATGPIHLAGCATMMEDNPELACAMMGVAGGLVGYAIGDDTGAAVAGAAIGALGCAFIQHLGAEDAKAVEDWQRTQLSSAPMDQAISINEDLPASDGGLMKTSMTLQASKPLSEMDGGSDFVDKEPWLKEDQPCRQAETGVSLDTKKIKGGSLWCLRKDEGGVDRWVEVKVDSYTTESVSA